MNNEGEQLVARSLNLTEAASSIKKVLKTDIVPFLWGPPGVGKSSLVRQICEEDDLELLDLRLSLLNPVDLRGLPVIDKENQLADWYPPGFFPKYDTKTRGILFLDEINLAPLSVQHAAYQLILDKRVGEYRLPTTWKIIAAGNRETDRANVYKMPAPLANRFVHFTIEPDYQTWATWAKKNIRPEVDSFLAGRPENLFRMPNDSQKAFPSPRSWAFVSDLLDAFEVKSPMDMSEAAETAIAGAIGAPAAKEFVKFFRDFDLQGISKQLEEFIITGKILIPTRSNTRFALSLAVIEAYKNKKVTPERFSQYIGMLKPEEAAPSLMIWASLIAKRQGVAAKFWLSKPLLSGATETLQTNDNASLPDSGRLEINDGTYREIVEFTATTMPNTLDKKVEVIRRGLFGTATRYFASGSLVTLQPK